MKIKVSKEWCKRSAEIEGESSVGAGAIGPLMSGSERRPCSPLVIEAVERCATMDEGWARAYAADAGRCELSKHPGIYKKAAKLRTRSEEHAAKARAYREFLSENRQYGGAA